MRPAVGSSKPAIIRSVVVLPGPGRAEHREELAVADVEVDAVDRDDVAVALLDALEPDRDPGGPAPRIAAAPGVDGRPRSADVGRQLPSRPLRWMTAARRRGDGTRTMRRALRRCQATARRRSGRRADRLRDGPAPPSVAVAVISRRGACSWSRRSRSGRARPARRRATAADRRPGTSGAPREVNLIAKDYSFLPATLDLVPGETVLLHVINGGLEAHEAIIGDAAVQDAWEAAEARTVGAPPGPTPRGQRAARRRGRPHRRALRRARRPASGRSRRTRPSAPAVGRRLPHPRPLGTRACRSPCAGCEPMPIARRLVRHRRRRRSVVRSTRAGRDAVATSQPRGGAA